jgi:hypothetical protein
MVEDIKFASMRRLDELHGGGVDGVSLEVVSDE